ncbi:MAG: TetR/AcrR family transcriptional regulator C-terminal domain-containing protein [Lachnospiraceae bacterium]|nr:TetR/AcrR family transcriptional regulator C-terminal domain-containing protein [Lachnospiraceae bacterium]
MNVDNNVRFKETEERIMRAYGRLARKMPINKISVSAICKEAGIHRTTFYGHFQDIIDLGDTVEIQQINRLVHDYIITDKFDFPAMIMAMFQFYYENRDIIRRHLFQTDDGEVTERIRKNFLPKELSAEYARCFDCQSDTELQYHQVFFENGFVNVLKQWLLTGCKEPYEEVARLIIKIYVTAMKPEVRAGIGDEWL